MDFEKKESNNQSMKEKFKAELKMLNRNIIWKHSYLRQENNIIILTFSFRKAFKIERK